MPIPHIPQPGVHLNHPFLIPPPIVPAPAPVYPHLPQYLANQVQNVLFGAPPVSLLIFFYLQY